MEFFKGMKRGLLVMDKYDLLKRINLLEYHQSLLLKLLSNPKLDFYRLIIEKGITEEEVKGFLRTCDELSMKVLDQKAEGFVYFYPLFSEFLVSLPVNLQVEEVIPACITQHIFESLMLEFEKYI
jgi:hypothetical protein